MGLVFLVLVFFLGNIRSAVIAAINVPPALLSAFTLMRLTDTLCSKRSPAYTIQRSIARWASLTY